MVWDGGVEQKEKRQRVEDLVAVDDLSARKITKLSHLNVQNTMDYFSKNSDRTCREEEGERGGGSRQQLF